MLVLNGSLVKCTTVIIGKYQSCYFSKVQCKRLAVTISNSDYVNKKPHGALKQQVGHTPGKEQVC